MVRSLAPEIPIRSVAGKPNTRSAIRVIAAAMDEDSTRGRLPRHDVYRALWQCKEDISNPIVLAAVAVTHGFTNLTPTSNGNDAVRAWQQEWEELGVNSLPALVRQDGEVMIGLVLEKQLRDFIEGYLAVGTRG